MRISDWSSDVCSSDLGCALVDLVTFADFASGFDCVSAGKVAIHAVGSGLRFKIADVDRGFAVGDEAAAPPRPGMADLCPVIDASGGAPFQTHIVDVGDGDSATRLLYFAANHARNAKGSLYCPYR